MTSPCRLPNLTLHVFEQDGGWNWCLTVDRMLGTGQKVIAYSEGVFSSAAQARADGDRAYWAYCVQNDRAELSGMGLIPASMETMTC